jgi:hypothetical protein
VRDGTIRPDPTRAERNLRNVTRFGGYVIQVYHQDVVDVLGELDRLRQRVEQSDAAAVASLDLIDQSSPTMLRAGRAGRG